MLDLIESPAYASSCTLFVNSNCTSGVLSETYTNCMLGGLTVSGTVTLAFSDGSCRMNAAHDTITRTANLTYLRADGASVVLTSVSPDGGDGGQQISVATLDGGFTSDFVILGMERKGTYPDGGAAFDIETSTAPDAGLMVTGLHRANRVLTSGTLVIQHKLAGYTATLTPNNLTWTGTCNCATSGSLTGTWSGTRTGDVTITITGCGTANISRRRNVERQCEYGSLSRAVEI